MTSLKEEMCEKDSSKYSPLFFWISSVLKQPMLTKALGWVHCPVPDTLSGMLHAGNASVMVLQKQPIEAVPHVVLHHAPYEPVLGFWTPGATNPI